MLTKAELEQLLESYPEGVESVHVSGSRNFVATVVSESFRGEDEAERQARIWGHLRETLDEATLAGIEFIFTNAPGEDTNEEAA